MNGVLVGGLALFAAGFAFGCARAWRRSRRSAAPAASGARSRAMAPIVVVAAAAVVFLVVTLMLAKLLDSDVLGWIFGLSLMAGIALLPCAVVFYAGVLLHAFLDRRRRLSASPEAQPAASHRVAITIDRDTVHASDEVPATRIELRSDATLRELLAAARAAADLPRISGGRATWVLEAVDTTGALPPSPIAVFAQQWPEPMPLIPDRQPLSGLLSGGRTVLKFRYRSQQDPHATVSELDARPPSLAEAQWLPPLRCLPENSQPSPFGIGELDRVTSRALAK